MKIPEEQRAPSVSTTDKQGAERPSRWDWSEPTVWTPRMLATLEKGVKGGKWFSLIDKVYQEDNLASAWNKVKAKKGAGGPDGQRVADFQRHAPSHLSKLQEQLQRDEYQPGAVRRTWIEKAGSKDKRPLGIPDIKDRVVQGALRHVLEPIFEHDFAEHSYGFRPRRSAKDALRRVADGYVRRRLRSILRQRQHLSGVSKRGPDHYRWKNAYFDELGLFCLATAQAQLRQSLRMREPRAH